MLFIVFPANPHKRIDMPLSYLVSGQRTAFRFAVALSHELGNGCFLRCLLRRSLMHTFHNHWNLFAIISLPVNLAMLPLPNAQERILVSYGGHNETVGPLWVAADKGFFKKSGLDVSILQVRNGQVSLTALMSGDVPPFGPRFPPSLAASPEARRSAASRLLLIGSHES